MKRTFARFTIGAILFTSISTYANVQYTAIPATFPVIVNGEAFEPQNGEILVVDGRTYLPLQDTAEALGIEVVWNPIIGRVEIRGNEYEPGTGITPGPTPLPIPQPTDVPTTQPSQTHQPLPTPSTSPRPSEAPSQMEDIDREWEERRRQLEEDRRNAQEAQEMSDDDFVDKALELFESKFPGGLDHLGVEIVAVYVGKDVMYDERVVCIVHEFDQVKYSYGEQITVRDTQYGLVNMNNRNGGLFYRSSHINYVENERYSFRKVS